ncbi:DNA polymerase delta catalytic subunit [Bienertia sinuspersici]
MISAQVNNVLCPKAYLINRPSVIGLHPLPPPPLKSVRCPPSKFRAPTIKITTNALKCRQSMPVCLSDGGARVGNENQKPTSVEDLLKQQIEKQEYYDEGGNPPGGRGGGSGGGGGGYGDLGGSEEEGSALEETIQVILATLGFIFLYMYIINGAEMTRLAKDYIKYILGGKKSIRLTRFFYQWTRFCKRFKPKKTDRHWLEKAIITTPTWWDSPEKYKLMLRAYMRKKSQRQSNDNEYDHE